MRLAQQDWLCLACSALVAGILASPLSQAQPVGGNDPLTLLKVDGGVPGAATAGTSACSPVMLKIKYQGNLNNSINERVATINAQMQRQDFSGAIGSARLAAEAFSYCFTKFGGQADPETYAAAVGHFLTEEVIAAHNGNEVNAEINAAEGRARALLAYAKGASQDTSADLAALDALAPKKQGPVSGVSSLTAQAVVTEFEGNQLRFDSKYDNHLLQISGPARKVSEVPGGIVWITIVGRTPEDRLWDDVICEITDNAQKAKAAQLDIPGPVTVSGTYHSAHGAINGGVGVRLSDCDVIGAGASAK